MSGLQLTLAPVKGGGEDELVDAEPVIEAAAVAQVAGLSPSPPPLSPPLAERNLFAEANRIAARATSPGRPRR